MSLKENLLSISEEARAWAKTLTPILIAWLHGWVTRQPKFMRDKEGPKK